MADRIGQQLGNYRLVRLLGEGGFAEVYLGEHIYLKTQVAVKVLHMHLVQEEFSGFLQEAQTIAHLKHPHIISVFDFGIDGVPFLVMDYLPRGSLRERYPHGTSVPLPTIVPYVNQVAAALQYAHDTKVIHRDVKPANMLVSSNDQIILSDFGIATAAHRTTSLQTMNSTGSPSYMAPEHVAGKPRPASDQYSLAIVVYEWLCGKLPFQGEPLAVMYKQTYDAVPSLREQVPTMASEVEQVVLTALAKDPQQRFASVQAFANALEQACEIAPHHSQPLPPNRSQPSPVINTPSYPSTQSPYLKPTDREMQQPTVMNTPSSQSIWPSGPPSQRLQPPTHSPTLTPEVPSFQPIPEGFIAAPTPGKNESHAPSHRGFPGGRAWILIALVITLLLGSVGWFAFPGLSRILTVSSPSTSPAQPRPSPMSPMFGFDPQHTRFNPDEHILSPTNASRLVQYWTASTGGRISSSPAVVNGVVYVGSHDGKLYAFNASTGALLWSMPTNGGIASSPAVANGVVYVGSYSLNSFLGSIYAFNASTGALLWSMPTNGFFLSSPAVVNGVVYIGSVEPTDNGKLYAFNASTGAFLWSMPISSAIHNSPPFSSPAVVNGVVYIGSVEKKLDAFNASTGALLWSMPTNGAITSSPAVVNGVVYVGSSDHTLDAFNASTGVLLWSTLTSNPTKSSPAVANGVVYIGSLGDANTNPPSKPGNIYAFNASTGAPLWSAPLGTSTVSLAAGDQFDIIAFSSPSVVNGVVYIGSDDGKLYAFHLPNKP